ncbi:MAG: 5-formyltetrahydrofolate cyclo-ligase [Parasporobacterium sp.]|nr:5-formyltetrahydrofolate cyclo-ligase [Parasporobacterium sp.]
MTKQEIRKDISAKKKAMTEEQIAAQSAALCEKFLATEAYKNAEVVYAYAPYNQEVRLNPIIEQAWKDGKKVALPKVFGETDMEFFYITAFDQLEPGCMGIPEPNAKITLSPFTLAMDKEALIIMPGLAFDKDGHRIGYGGGYYDRYLESHKGTKFTKIALAYDFQMVDHLDVEDHDQLVEEVILP